MRRSTYKVGGALILLLLLLGIVTGTSFAQPLPTIQYRLVYIGNNTYEVRMNPQNVPSNVTTGGQVTVRVPTGEGPVTNLSVPAPYAAAGAAWTQISLLLAPPGATQYDYYTYYWDPSLFIPGSAAAYQWNTDGQEVVAFTFQLGSGCPASGPVELVDNATDPYINGSPLYDITNNLQISDPSGPIEIYDGLYTGPAGAIESDCSAVPGAPTVVEPVDGSTVATATPLITGTVPITDNVTEITVLDGSGNVICTDTLEPDLGETTWSCTPTTPLPEGVNTLQVIATNRGQTDGAPTPFAVTVDTIPPTAPAITSPTDGSSTNDDTPTISGTAETGSTVDVTDGSGNPVCTATADASGNWSCTPTTALPEGTTPLTATATDPAGNTSTPSTPTDVTVDTTPPTAPAITGPTDGSSTNDPTPTISGTAEPGSTVDVTDGSGNPVCTTTADASGNWSCTPTTALPEGTTTLTATPTDPAGNVGTPSAPIDVTVDTIAPTAPVITSPTDGSSTNDDTPTISGTAEPGSTVDVTDGSGNSVCTATADASGNWSCTPTTPLPEGTTTLTATPTDPAGNTSMPSTPTDVTVDTTPPTAPAITSPTDGSSTNDDTPTISGTAEPGSTVDVTDGSGNPVCTATADASGNWSCTPTTPLPEGTTTLTATPTDPAGNVGSPSAPIDVTMDTTPPTAPAVTGPSAGSTITDTTPTITGVTEPGSTVEVTDSAGNPVCTATADASGNWSCTPTSPLPGGNQTLDVTATDPAGNVSPPTSLPITVLAEKFLDLRVYLGGAYVFGSPLMRDALRTVPSFPTSEPYSQSPYSGKFTHVGDGGGETIGSGVLAVTGDDAIVDWVFIELRSTTTTVVATQSALVQRDGDVVAAGDGTSLVGFAVAPDDYYIVVRHRNHLGVMTANPVTLGGTTAVVDFTTGVGTYGGDGVTSQQPFGSEFALRPGDANADGTVKYSGAPNDLSVVRNSFFVDNNFSGSLSYAGPEVTAVYHRADLNLDGNVRNVTDVPVLRNTVLQFPTNTTGYLNSALVVTTVP